MPKNEQLQFPILITLSVVYVLNISLVHVSYISLVPLPTGEVLFLSPTPGPDAIPYRSPSYTLPLFVLSARQVLQLSLTKPIESARRISLIPSVKPRSSHSPSSQIGFLKDGVSLNRRQRLFSSPQMGSLRNFCKSSVNHTVCLCFPPTGRNKSRSFRTTDKQQRKTQFNFFCGVAEF